MLKLIKTINSYYAPEIVKYYTFEDKADKYASGTEELEKGEEEENDAESENSEEMDIDKVEENNNNIEDKNKVACLNKNNNF